MANNQAITTCPEIANQNDDAIELSTYNTSAGTNVVIGCKGFGRHVSDPTNVVCLDTGAWSETPNLKCKIAFDEEERMILGAALASVVLVLLVLACLCCYSCCCRKRRRHYRHHHYKGWRGLRDSKKDDWRTGWTGWESQKGSGEFGNKNERKGGWWTRWTSRKDSVDYPRDKNERKGGWWSGFTSRKEYVDPQGEDKERNGGLWSGLSSRKEYVDPPGEDKERKGGLWSGLNSRKGYVDPPGDDKERKNGWWSGLSNRKEYVDSPGEDKQRKGGWWWTKWNSRSIDDISADNNVKRHYHYHGTSVNPEKNLRQEYGYTVGNKERRNSYSNGSVNIRHTRRFVDEDKHSIDRQEIIRSNNYEYNPPHRVRRYSDPSVVVPGNQYRRPEIIYESEPNEVQYNRVRRFSDPMVYRSNYVRPRHQVTYTSKPVTYQDTYRPSYTVVKANEASQQILEREPTTFEYDRQVLTHASPEVLRYIEPTHVLDPLYYTEPRHYRSSPRHYTSLYSEDRFRHPNVHRRHQGQLVLQPLSLDAISNYVNLDLNHRNANWVQPSTRILDLDNAARHRQILAGGDAVRASGAHYEVTGINPVTSYFSGRQDYHSEIRPDVDDKVRNYMLYQGRGKATEVLDNPIEFGEKSRIIY